MEITGLGFTVGVQGFVQGVVVSGLTGLVLGI